MRGFVPPMVAGREARAPAQQFMVKALKGWAGKDQKEEAAKLEKKKGTTP